MARRWRDCNSASPETFEKSDDEDLWRDKTLDLLSKAHTIGGIADFTLETVESNYSVRTAALIVRQTALIFSLLPPTGIGSRLDIGV
jgi:hypothetical protein